MKNAPKYARLRQHFKFRVIYFACPTSKINYNNFVFGLQIQNRGVHVFL